jgi:Na+/H+ antiporter NhaD/arsenite permease-like protein
VSAESEIYRGPGRARAADVVGGYLSALAMFAAAVSLAWHPLRLSPAAMAIALVAAAMTRRNRALALAGVGIAALCFFLGMAIAVVTSRPLW